MKPVYILEFQTHLFQILNMILSPIIFLQSDPFPERATCPKLLSFRRLITLIISGGGTSHAAPHYAVSFKPAVSSQSSKHCLLQRPHILLKRGSLTFTHIKEQKLDGSHSILTEW
jgi:hypothetical protein